MWHGTRRQFLTTTSAAIGSLTLPHLLGSAAAASGLPPADVHVLHPRKRVPVSFIIDDSTCLVNMGRFCMPQFATAWPQRDEYKKPWQRWPAEIPDAFLREFGQWCAENGVKGKFSIVPYPALVGWLDRELPGWSRRALQDSLKLVRELFVPHWDIHPEMISHTRVIDIATGRPMAAINAGTMENSYPTVRKSVDELTAYLAYALRILNNCELPCEGITTPGGFGNLVKSELSLAVQQAVREVFAAEIPHYFKYVADGDESTEPRIEHLQDATGPDPRLTVSIYAGTGDWYGGWDGVKSPEPDRYCSADGQTGRLVELIKRGQPATMLCHWPGLFGNGTRAGFRACQRVIRTINSNYGDRVIWMKTSELARYWAARQLTRITRDPNGDLQLHAPFATPAFTIDVPHTQQRPPVYVIGDKRQPLRQVSKAALLQDGCWWAAGARAVVCIGLAKGQSRLIV